MDLVLPHVRAVLLPPSLVGIAVFYHDIVSSGRYDGRILHSDRIVVVDTAAARVRRNDGAYVLVGADLAQVELRILARYTGRWSDD